MDSARVSVRVHPGARRDTVTGRRGEIVHVGLTAPDGGDAADRALIALLARRLRIDPDRITVVSGIGLRVKLLRIEGVSQAGLDVRLRHVSPGAAQRWSWALAGGAGAVAIAVAAIVLGSGSSPPAHRPRSGGAPLAAAPATTTARHLQRRHYAPRHRVRRPPSPDPGRLPQTGQLPSSETREFASRMLGLWAAIAGAPVDSARPAFFPEAAYVQLKSLGDPVGDFENRLYYDYRLDIAAAHALLGSQAPTSRLIRATAVPAYAHWVPAGVCDNRVGYYELPNVRLVYQSGGQVRSIGVASMISWRGIWYVVHLGAILRGSAGGVVNTPSVGAGVSVASSTC